MDNNTLDSNLKISEDAISSIIELAINEVEGVFVFDSGLASKLIKKKPIHIEMNEDSISVEVSVSVKYGNCIQELIPKAQENIKTNIEIMTSLKVSNIDVHVLGITID